MTIDERIAEFKVDLLKLNRDEIFYKYFTKEKAYLFDTILNKPHIEDDIKKIVSTALGTKADRIFLMGSSKLGFSISPKKLFQPVDNKFNESKRIWDKSDLDVAIVCNKLFNRIGREVYNYTESYQKKWKYNEYYKNPTFDVILCYKFFEYFTKGWFRMDFKPKGYNVCIGDWDYQKLIGEVYSIADNRKVTLAIYSEDFYFKHYNLQNISNLAFQAERELITK